MQLEHQGIYRSILRNFKDFLNYLTSIWGLLSIFTPLFPLFDKISNILPIPKLYPYAAVFATLACLFGILRKFTTRSSVEQDHISALTGFRYAMFSSLIYLIIFSKLETTSLNIIKTNSWKTFMEILHITIEPILYVMIFWHFTQSFGTLAVYELQKKENIDRVKK